MTDDASRLAEDTWERLLTAISDPYRRQLLVALLDHNPQDDTDLDPLDVVAETERESTVLESELVHTHLPKLDTMEIVEWDRDTGEISTGPEWNQVAPILELIHDHRDELPEGWL
ncbi:DUF7344 domain-containing protein [Halorientalis regularis]|jgi:hypothetical protein|uniref:DUF7344 domain-containing protein n=1 Tax=Halorientalis regularis TaxID=660518 RepID=A0A1G7F4W4_9EURY|nr:hypothetical protein [Halorientalis regularis]SDE70917.1 hypothetical protein SAMN05216218_10126 [Halorientalis regularis]